MKDLVKCEECKHLIEKQDAQLVPSNWSSGIWFCPLHKKNCRYIMVYPRGKDERSYQYFQFKEITKAEASLTNP